MKRLLLVLALLWPAQAGAAGRHVKPDESDAVSDSTCTFANPCSMQNANLTARPADTVYVYPGVYGTFPQPVNSGTAGNNRIDYKGTVADSSQVIIAAGGSFARSFVSYKFMTFDAPVTGFNRTANSVSLWRCQISGKISFGGADNCGLNNVATPAGTYSLQEFKSDWHGVNDPTNYPMDDTLNACVFNWGPNVSQYSPMAVYGAANWVIKNCRFNLKMNLDPDASNPAGRWFAQTTGFKLSDNYWDVEAVGPGSGWEAFYQRDSVNAMVETRDTLVMRGQARLVFYPATSGSFNGSVRNNRYDQCVILNLTGEAGVEYQTSTNTDQWTNNVIVAPGAPAFIINRLHAGFGAGGLTNLDHNTFVGRSDLQLNGYPRGVVLLKLTPPPSGMDRGRIRFTNNLVYDLAVPATGTGSTDRRAVLWNNGAGNAFPLGDSLKSNWNVYALGSFQTRQGDRSIAWVDTTSWSTVRSGNPDTSTSSASWWAIRNQDGASGFVGSVPFYGGVVSKHLAGPAFTDSVVSDGWFDAHPTLESGHLAADSAGAAAGAYGLPPDGTRPGPISDLTASNPGANSVVLSWTGVGDDSLTGLVRYYEIRYSQQTITEANWSSATLFAQVAPTGTGGTAESAVVSGLQATTTYYFAIKAYDDVSNPSALSNTAGTTTTSGGPPGGGGPPKEG